MGSDEQLCAVGFATYNNEINKYLKVNQMDKIKIALPSKGRLRRDMETLFKAKQISFANLSNDRDYIGSVEA